MYVMILCFLASSMAASSSALLPQCVCAAPFCSNSPRSQRSYLWCQRGLPRRSSQSGASVLASGLQRREDGEGRRGTVAAIATATIQ